MEEWFDIPGWEGIYQINKIGKVKRIQLNIIQNRTRRDGTPLAVPKKLAKERIKKWNLHRGNYRVHLTYNGKDEIRTIPELLLLTFHPEIEVNKIDKITYKDNNPSNVQFDNLILSFN